jgi:hypothetical protein
MNKKEVLLAGTVSISLRRVSFCVCVFLPSSVFHLLFFFFFVFAFLFYFLLFLNKKKMERRVASHLLTYGGGGERIHNDVCASLSRALSGLCCGRTPLSLFFGSSPALLSRTRFPLSGYFRNGPSEEFEGSRARTFLSMTETAGTTSSFPSSFFFLLKKIPN